MQLSKASSATQGVSKVLAINKMASLAPTRKHVASQSEVQEDIQEDKGSRDLTPGYHVFLIKIARRQGTQGRPTMSAILGRGWDLGLSPRT